MTYRHDSGFSAVELLIAVAIVGALAAMSVPISGGLIDDIRLRGDAQGLSSAVQLAKMTAAAKFTRARVHVDTNANTYRIEFLQAGAWTTEGGVQYLSRDGRFGAGAVTVPPPNTQAALAQPPACRDDDDAEIAGTACVIFNSRGLPVSSAGAPVTTQAVYLRSPSGVFGIVVGATGQLQVWRSAATTNGTWRQQ